jgi:hypothetical protein
VPNSSSILIDRYVSPVLDFLIHTDIVLISMVIMIYFCEIFGFMFYPEITPKQVRGKVQDDKIIVLNLILKQS